VKNNTKNFKGNLGRVQDIAQDLDDEAYGCWQKANTLRDKAVDCLGNVNQSIVDEIRILSAKSIGLGRAAKSIKEILNRKPQEP
jgi:hypothetical protein